METIYTTANLHDFDSDLQNIISINSPEEDEFDFDFDYDPNEMYYELTRS